MRILHVTHSLNPLKGGTSVAVKSMAEGCGALGVDSPVVVLDSPGDPWLEDWRVEVMPVGPSRTHFGWTPRLRQVLLREVPRVDAVVVHGLWQYHNLEVRRVCQQAGVPYLVYPHGMLDPWALGQSRLVKRLVWRLVVGPLLKGAAGLCFTTENEKSSAAVTLERLPVRALIQPLGVNGPPDSVDTLRAEFIGRLPLLADRKILLFLGRLHAKKGCDILIEGFARWRSGLPEDERAKWHLRMVGPPDTEEYSALLTTLVQRHGLDPGQDVTMPGMMTGRLCWQEIAGAEVFVLPSHQENFGIAVGEALACGRPVLLSDCVNIWPWVVRAGAGLVEPDTATGVYNLLQRWSALTLKQQLAAGRLARELFDRQFSVITRCKDFVEAVAVVVAECGKDRAHQPSILDEGAGTVLKKMDPGR